MVIGRDVRADVRVPHPLVSRAHVAAALPATVAGSRSTTRAGTEYSSRNQRVHSVDIRSGEIIHIGDPDGPRLTFELGAEIACAKRRCGRSRSARIRHRAEYDSRTAARPTCCRTLPPHRCASAGRARPCRRHRVDHDRPRPRQRHRYPGRAGLATTTRRWCRRRRVCRYRTPTASMARSSTASASRTRCCRDERRRHDRQRRLGLRQRQAGPSHRTR